MMRRARPVLALAALLACSITAGAATPDDRLVRATEAFHTFLTQSRPPADLLQASTCIVVLPRVIEGAFGLGGKHGAGVMSCRRQGGEWSPPAFLKISGGSIGLQIGFESSDVVLLVVSERSARSLLRSKFTLGADAEVAAGPKDAGVGATTDIRLDAEIYSYENSTGFFAGASLGGAKLKLARKDISRYYPERPVPEDLLFGSAEVNLSSAAADFRAALP